MTIQSPALLAENTIRDYGQKLGPEGKEYVQALFKAVTDGWKSWQDSITFGGFKVSGAGTGAWSGTGVNGKMQGSLYVMPEFSFKGDSKEQKKFTNALAKVLSQKFTEFPASYSITTISFMGQSGATSNSPGPVNGNNVPVPVGQGKGTNPAGIASQWRGLLLPPDFDLGNPNCKSGPLVDAIGKNIEKAFDNWLKTTMLTGCSFSTTGKPGGSVTNFSAGMNGKLA